MTYLIVTSIFLIVASAGALALGWVTANESLVWTSIAATAGAAVLLALAYYRSIRVLRSPIEAGVVPELEAEDDPDQGSVDGDDVEVSEDQGDGEPETPEEGPSTEQFAGPQAGSGAQSGLDAPEEEAPEEEAPEEEAPEEEAPEEDAPEEDR